MYVATKKQIQKTRSTAVMTSRCYAVNIASKIFRVRVYVACDVVSHMPRDWVCIANRIQDKKPWNNYITFLWTCPICDLYAHQD